MYVQHESSGATVHTRRRRSNVRNRLTFKLTSKYIARLNAKNRTP